MPDENVVRNEGSTARDHLANERTFLAWVRTALGVIGLGVLLAKLVETGGALAEIAGLVLVAYGAVTLVYALVRYERLASHLQRGEFRVAKGGPMILGIVSLGVAIGAFVLILLLA